MQTKDDVGDIPGRAPLSDAEKQAIADARNAFRVAQAARQPVVSVEQRLAALEADVAALKSR